MAYAALPSVVFAPGAWHEPSCFSLVVTDLKRRGYETKGIKYPSVGAEPPTKGLADDAAAARAVIEMLVNQGKQVVLVAHSYGGMVGANAVDGLSFNQRVRNGKRGGVVMLLYLSAFINPKGASLLKQHGGEDSHDGPFLPWMLPSEIQGAMGKDGGYVTIIDPENVLYHDVEPELRKTFVARLRHQSSPIFTGKAAYEPWHDIDCAYFFCEDDRAIPLAVQEAMAGLLPKDSLTFRAKTSHSPFLSRPKEVVEALVKAAQIGQERATVWSSQCSKI